jgi:hypothetical protein
LAAASAPPVDNSHKISARDLQVFFEMSATCVGVLILGVCVLVPGQSRTEVRARGWIEFCGNVMRGPDGTGFEGTQSPPSWKGRIAGSLGGAQDTLDAVDLMSIDGSDVIQKALRRYCRGTGDRWTCTAAGQPFVAERCRAIFWGLRPVRPRDAGTESWCAPYASLLESVVGTEKPALEGTSKKRTRR